MSEFLNYFNTFEMDIPIVVFLMLFSCGIAIFHTVILSGILKLNFRPKWLFFALNPTLIGCTYLIFHHGYALLTFTVLFLSVFVLGLIAMIISTIRDNRKKVHYPQKNPKPLWKKIWIGTAVIVFIIVFFLSGPYAVLIIIVSGIVLEMLPSSKNRFLKYQAILPTSKIRSAAMGLIEIEGTAISKTPLESRILKKACIGYKYVIEDITKDKDGDYNYSEVFSETICERFYIRDTTGQIEVNPKKIEFIWMPLDEQYSSGSNRYSQYLLKENDEVLIIGKASLEGNTPIIEHENIKDVFGITLQEKINHYNTYKPLLNSFFYFTAVFALFMALLLIAPITIKEGIVTIEVSSRMFNWNDFFSNFKPF